MPDRGIRYSPLPDATPESELEALVACYSFLVERSEQHKAAEHNGGKEKATVLEVKGLGHEDTSK